MVVSVFDLRCLLIVLVVVVSLCMFDLPVGGGLVLFGDLLCVFIRCLRLDCRLVYGVVYYELLVTFIVNCWLLGICLL